MIRVAGIAGTEKLVNELREVETDEPVNMPQPGCMYGGDCVTVVFVGDVEGVPEVAEGGFRGGMLRPGP
jgi:hypothetical protein